MDEQTNAEKSADPGVAESSKKWCDKIKSYRDKIGDDWEKQCDNLDKLYSREGRADTADREYAIFWANIEVLKEASYSRAPVPVVAQRFKQRNVLASTASEVLERCIVTNFELADLDGCMMEVRDEFLRYGRGTPWARLGMNRNGTERVEYDFVTGSDFAHGPCRAWREVPWVAKRAWLTREKGKKRFDEPLAKYGKKFDEVPFKKKDENSAMPDKADEAPVWELWDKEEGKVVWFVEGFDCVLDKQDPWLDLTNFWPCPKPAYGTKKPKGLKPIPDIRQYKDQIEEINDYTGRIAALSQALRVKGFYPAGAGELSEAIEQAFKSLDDRAILVPISSFAALGGASPKDAVIWLPIEQVLKTIQGLVELRRVVIEDVYQITGIADIVRGQTDPGETLGAQQLKSQWGSLRISGRQKELARVGRDLARITGEIIAENFAPETMAEMAQVELPTAEEKAALQAQMEQAQQQAQMTGQPAPPVDAQMLEQPTLDDVFGFLRDDRARSFVIEIETDSTIQPDEDAEKNRRTEFVTAVGGLFQQAIPVVQTMPQAAPFLGEVLKFTAQGFRAGRSLEGAIDEFVDQLKQLGQPQQPQPDPDAEAKAKEAELKLRGTEASTEATVTKAQADIAKTQMGMQESAQEHQQTMEQMVAQASMPQPNGAPR